MKRPTVGRATPPQHPAEREPAAKPELLMWLLISLLVLVIVSFLSAAIP